MRYCIYVGFPIIGSNDSIFSRIKSTFVGNRPSIKICVTGTNTIAITNNSNPYNDTDAVFGDSN